MERHFITKSFLLVLIVFVLYASFIVFKPFLAEILAAAVLVSIFYAPYQELNKFLRGRKHLSSLIMCLLIAALVIIPLVNFIAYAAGKSTLAYSDLSKFIEGKQIGEIVHDGYLQKFNALGISSDTFRKIIIEVADKAQASITAGAAIFIKGTTGFFISLGLTIFTMFFFFVDGEKLLKQLMHLTPLPNKYDREIFKKFRDVSYSTVMSTFFTAIAQGLIGSIGLIVVGVPAFFAGIAMAFLSLVPYIGTALVWFPVAIYLLVIGNIWQGVFLLIWGGLVISWTDNLIRAYLIKEKAQVHPIFIIFSILGGIIAFGFWGVIFGPLIVALTVTILHIYEMEYRNVLEK